MIAPELMNVQPQSMFQKVYAYSSSFKCTFITTIVLLGVAAVLAIVLSTINCSWYYYSEAIFACIFLFFFMIALLIVGVGFAIAAGITYCNATSQINNIDLIRLYQQQQQQQQQPYMPPQTNNNYGYVQQM
jgi:hypothetical protein